MVEKAEKPKKEKKADEPVKVKEEAVEEDVSAPKAAVEPEEAEEPILGASSGILGEVPEISDESILKKKVRVGIEEELTEERQAVWVPKTDLGNRVYKGEITSMQQISRLSLPIKEVQIIDRLLPSLQEEIIDVGRVQRTTDSGRRTRFRVVAAVGNGNGFIGLGEAKGKEAGPTIRKAIEKAKLEIKEIKRGCGSWECGCGKPHTVPFKVSGKSGSIEVVLKPAPRGVGIVSGEIAKSVLSLAGITDVWVTTSGHTRTGINFALATFNALVNTNYMKVGEREIKSMNILTGSAKEVSEEKDDAAAQEGA